ncbi:MAG: hypothetical protein FWC87_05615 [Acidimicrobiaceae bacterium]|nr:hypothetical protein [Acidimicrobiaceae bacterium]
MKIERVEIIVTELGNRIQRQLSSGSYDTGAPGTILGKPVLVRIYADGVVGTGQVRPISPGHFIAETTSSVVAAVRDIYGPLLLGRSIFDREGIWSSFDRRLPGNSNARAAIDYALFDAAGKALGRPAYDLLGGLCQPEIPLEWSISMADTGQMIEDALSARDDYGIDVLCMKAGGPGGWARDVENFAALREAVGEGVTIGVDPNTGWTVTDTLRALRALEPMDLGYLEQPVDRYDLDGLARIRRAAGGVPLMADESLFTLRDAFELARVGAVDVLCIKLYKTAGLAQAKRITAVAEASNMRVNIGGLAVQSQLEAAAGAHFYASTPEERVMPAAEFIFGLGVGGQDPLVAESDFTISHGKVKVPAGPGLGVVLDEAAVRAKTLAREVAAPT